MTSRPDFFPSPLPPPCKKRKEAVGYLFVSSKAPQFHPQGAAAAEPRPPSARPLLCRRTGVSLRVPSRLSTSAKRVPSLGASPVRAQSCFPPRRGRERRHRVYRAPRLPGPLLVSRPRIFVALLLRIDGRRAASQRPTSPAPSHDDRSEPWGASLLLIDAAATASARHGVVVCPPVVGVCPPVVGPAACAQPPHALAFPLALALELARAAQCLEGQHVERRAERPRPERGARRRSCGPRSPSPSQSLDGRRPRPRGAAARHTTKLVVHERLDGRGHGRRQDGYHANDQLVPVHLRAPEPVSCRARPSP